MTTDEAREAATAAIADEISVAHCLSVSESKVVARRGFDAGVVEGRRQGTSAALREAADRIEPFSGIGLSNGATRAEVSAWLRDWANEIDPDLTT